MPWPCFWIERTGKVRVILRRSADGPCEAQGGGEKTYHDGRSEPVETLRRKIPGPGQYERVPPPVERYEGHPAWPKRCACGYRFRKGDRWHVWAERVYRRADDGGETTIRDAPPGAMWDAWWMPDAWRGPDGRSLGVALPPDGGTNYWLVDGPASRWSRTGEPPRITVTPSIAAPGYHGFLTNGVLTDPV